VDGAKDSRGGGVVGQGLHRAQPGVAVLLTHGWMLL
jgi:hypothetical protein